MDTVLGIALVAAWIVISVVALRQAFGTRVETDKAKSLSHACRVRQQPVARTCSATGNRS